MVICFVTNLPLWSLAEGKGAPSFFNTIKMFVDRGHSVILLTTEDNPKLGVLRNKVNIVKIPRRAVIENRMFGGVFRLVHKHYSYMKSQRDITPYLEKYAITADILYAYEIGFVPGVVKYARRTGKVCVGRFQGTVMTDLVQSVSTVRKLRLYLQFFDHIRAMRALPDVTIMTDDGTKGDRVLSYLRQHDSERVHFFKNGVDFPNADHDDSTYQKLHAEGDIIFSSVCRLQRWKRVDRSIEIFSKFHARFKNSHYYIVGDGPEIENLRKLVSQKGLQKNVSLVGAQDKSEIYSLLNDTKYFLSSYELSNLGNPLFEAISCGAVVATLNNGSTSKMIVDGVTGLISDENDFRRNALKLIECEMKPELLTMMRVAARNHLAINFDSWDQRMEREYDVLKTFL